MFQDADGAVPGSDNARRASIFAIAVHDAMSSVSQPFSRN